MKKTKRAKINSREIAKLKSCGMRKRRKKRAYILYYILIFIIFLTLGISLSLTVFFNIDVIEVRGTGEYSTDDILSASEVKVGDNLLREKKKKTEERILDSCLELEKVNVKQSFPNKLIIDCEPCELKFSYQKNDGRYIYISRYGRIVEPDQPCFKNGLMILKIDGEEPQNYQKGEYFQISKENKTKIDNLISTIDNVGLKDVSEIELSENGAHVTYQNRVIIDIFDMSNAQYMLKMAASILDEYIGMNENGRIFLDFSTQSVHFLPENAKPKF